MLILDKFSSPCQALGACAALVSVALLVAGCSSEQIYNAAAGWRRNECNRIGDAQQRERCLREEADRPYDAYRKALPPPQ